MLKLSYLNWTSAAELNVQRTSKLLFILSQRLDGKYQEQIGKQIIH